MKAVVQRVSKASVTIKDEASKRKETGRGIVVLLGIGKEDTGEDVNFLADKIANLRIFPEDGKLSLSVISIGAEVLVVPQFTLFGDCSKGRRPDFTNAADPEKAKALYELFIDSLKLKNLRVEEGKFGSEMLVEIHNDGPVTILLDTDILLKKNNR